MLERIRGALLKQRIGAIVIAFLIYGGIVSLIRAFVVPLQSGFIYASFQTVRGGMMPSRPPFEIAWMLPQLTEAALEFLAAWLLYRWIFAEAATSAAE